MSDVICAVKIEADILIYIDFDRPCWQNRDDKKLATVPHPDHFVVDGILGAASKSVLDKLGVARNYSAEEFENGNIEVELARKIVYAATGYFLEYFNTGSQESWIDQDFAKFKNQVIVSNIDQKTLEDLVRRN